MEIPKEILEIQTDLEVSVDVMSVNKLPFLLSGSKRLNSTTI